ncbi:hypothetical protein [Corynebacterium sp.]|uniref:hypothetical protein n=1 Tax=Corynebacterium sp. TaxID=1720 RepID=UPI0028AD76C6|nr:hypothetical protein [Corynebacterium sp.]
MKGHGEIAMSQLLQFLNVALLLLNRRFKHCLCEVRLAKGEGGAESRTLCLLTPSTILSSY